jgi:DNA-binding MarR family transcriptional regulator
MMTEKRATRRGLQEEIGQSRPFRTPHQEAALSVLRTADVLRRYFSRLLSPYGLTLQQYNVLRILRGARPQPLPTMEIRARMVEKTPGITRFVDRLEAMGLLARTRRTDDRRCVLCSITAAGLELLASLDQEVASADVEALSMLTAAEAERLVELLESVRAGHPGI